MSYIYHLNILRQGELSQLMFLLLLALWALCVFTPQTVSILSLLTSDALYLPEKFNVLAPVTLLGAILPYTENKFIMKNSQSKPWKTYTELCCVQNAVQ